MKDSWERKRISEFAEVISGGTPSTSVEEFWNGDVVWITPSDLSKIKYPKIDSSIKKITELGLNNSSANLIPARSIVMSSRAPIGYFAIPTIDFSTNQGCKSIKLNNQQDELFHYYNFLFNVETFKKKGEGTTFAEISKKEIEKLVFKFPPLPQQRKIAKILSTVDEVLEKTEAAIAKYQQLKQGLMHDVFTRGIDVSTGQLRPKQTQAPELYEQSDLGWIPKEWEVDNFENSTEIITDFTANGSFESLRINVKYYYERNYGRLIRLTDLRQDLQSDGVYVDKEGFEYLAKSELKTNDIMLANVGEYTGFACLMPEVNYPATIAPNMFLVRTNKELFDSQFMYYFMTYPLFTKQVDNVSASSATKLLNKTNFRAMHIFKPNIKEQTIFAKKLQSIDQKIHTEQQALAKYKQLKAGLLQDLLTGRVEVSA